MLADRIGERTVVGIGLGGAGTALAGAAFAPGFVLLVLLLVVAGLFGASVNAASGRAVMHWFDSAQRGLALGVRQTAVPLGGALAALLLPPIASAGGVEAGLLSLGGFCLAAGLAGTALLRESPGGPVGGELASMRHPLRDARIWRLSWGSALLLTVPVGVGGFTVLFLHERRGFSTAAAAAVLAAAQVLGGAGRILAGLWSDRLGARIVPLRRLSVVMALAVAATAVLVDAPGILVVPAFVGAVALGMSWNGLSFTAAAELAGHARSGAALGFQQTALAVAGAAVPVAFAALVAATSWRAGFALVALCPLAAVLVFRRLSV